MRTLENNMRDLENNMRKLEGNYEEIGRIYVNCRRTMRDLEH